MPHEPTPISTTGICRFQRYKFSCPNPFVFRLWSLCHTYSLPYLLAVYTSSLGFRVQRYWYSLKNTIFAYQNVATSFRFCEDFLDFFHRPELMKFEPFSFSFLCIASFSIEVASTLLNLHIKFRRLEIHENMWWARYWLVKWFVKGQTKSKWFSQANVFSKNERTNSILLLWDLFSFVFWRKSTSPKNHFEINWPLAVAAGRRERRGAACHRRHQGAMHSVLPQGCNVLLGVPEIVVHRVHMKVI